MVQYAIRNALAVVADRHSHSMEILLNRYLRLGGSRMQENVCETGLYDAEERKFGFFRQSGQFFTYFHFHVQTVALVNSFNIPPDCSV